MSKGTLYVVATPIGNLADLSHRAAESLAKVDLVACEDTRRSVKLLNHYGIRRPLESYHEFNEAEKAEELAARIGAGADVALISDAGTPTVSDPGYRLVRLCRAHAIPIVPIPGPSASVAALSVSGLPSDVFFFGGFLPARKSHRRRKLASVESLPATLIFYETPRRIRSALEDMLEILGDREIFVGRELTKLHEEHLCGRIAEVLPRIVEKGEFVIVVEGNRNPKFDSVDVSGLTRKQLLRLLSTQSGIAKKQLYDILFKKDEERD